MMMELLPLVWMMFLALSIGLYVILDGFSLGVGILFPWVKGVEARDTMVRTVLPVWDGNQTWLVSGGAALLTAFPMAFNQLLSALFLPMMLMLMCLVLRGAAIEFRFKSERRRPWNIAYAVGSIGAAMCQGLILGVYVDGFGTEPPAGSLGFSGLFSTFSIFCAFAIPTAYALLGCCWLVVKTTGNLQTEVISIAKILWWLVVLAVAVVSIWTPMLEPLIAERWFAMPHLLLLSPIPFWTAVSFGIVYYGLRNLRWEPLAMVGAVGVFLGTLVGLGVSIWPYIVPHSATVWDAAAPANSLLFTLVGVVIVVPVIFAYTIHNYYVFRGKVDEGMEY